MNYSPGCSQTGLRRKRRFADITGLGFWSSLSLPSSVSLNSSAAHLLGILILILCPFYVGAQEVSDVVRVDVDLVTVNVSVKDGKGRAVSGLKSDNFLVTDQSEVVSLASLASDGPASIVFVVDISSSMRTTWKSLLNGMKTFLEQSPKENDYSLIVFNEQPKLLVESVSSVVLRRTLNELRPEGETALYDGLLEGLKVMPRVPRRRKALLLISDGQDTGSHKTITDVEQAAALGNTTIYGIGIKLREYCSPALPEFCHGIEVLNAISTATGGISRFPMRTLYQMT